MLVGIRNSADQVSNRDRRPLGRRGVRRVLRNRQSVHGQTVGADPALHAPTTSIARCGRRTRHSPPARLAEADRLAPWRAAAQARRPRRRALEVPRRDRSPRQRQAHRRDEHRPRRTWRSGTTTTAASPTRSRARSSRPTSPTSSTTHATSRSAWSPRSSRGIRRCFLDDVEAGAGAGGGQHDRHQAVGVHVGVAARVHEAGRAGRHPAGRRQRRHRLRPGSGHAAGRASARREGGVHRLRRHRTARLRGRGARNEARQHGARRQIAQHRVRRCRSRQRREGRRVGHLRRDGTDLRRRLAAARAGEHPRSVRREAARARANGEDGQSDGARHAGRPDHQQAAVREGAELHRYRQVARARRRCSAAGARRPPSAATAGSSNRRSSAA